VLATKISSQNIIGWYDGPVQSILQTDNGPFLLLLLACRMPQQIERLFLIFPLQGEQEKWLLEAFEHGHSKMEAWEEHSNRLNEFIRLHRDAVYLTLDQPIEDQKMQLHRYDDYSLDGMVPYNHDDAWNEDVWNRWFGIYERIRTS
jgi:hypothetical protein